MSRGVTRQADHVVGVHVTQLFSFPSGNPAELERLSEEDMGRLQFIVRAAPVTGPLGEGIACTSDNSVLPPWVADASDDSRPILERLGFVPVTATTPYIWSPPTLS